jgi:short-subunit dehydrogenase
MKTNTRPVAIVTGASAGIGLELAKCCARDGFDLLVAADRPLDQAAAGSYQAVYNGTKAFIDSFCFAIRHELKDTGVTVACLMPGATETDFFERADMMDTEVGTEKKDDPADVAKTGFDAMMRGDGDVVSGWQNKLQAAIANITPPPGSRQSTLRRPDRELRKNRGHDHALLHLWRATRTTRSLARGSTSAASF